MCSLEYGYKPIFIWCVKTISSQTSCRRDWVFNFFKEIKKTRSLSFNQIQKDWIKNKKLTARENNKLLKSSTEWVELYKNIK